MNSNLSDTMMETSGADSPAAPLAAPGTPSVSVPKAAETSTVTTTPAPAPAPAEHAPQLAQQSPPSAPVAAAPSTPSVLTVSQLMMSAAAVMPQHPVVAAAPLMNLPPAGMMPVMPVALPGGLLPPGPASSALLGAAGVGIPGVNVSGAPEPLDRCNVFVKYLPPDMRDEGLYELFSGCGRITSCKVMLDHKTHTSLGYGFVRFSTPEEALKTIEKMSGHQVGNKTLLCKLSNCSPAPAQTPCNNLYVKPLLTDTTEEQLKALFSVYGRVEECRVMLDKRTGRSRQIGFVRFSMLHEATTALKRMNGARISSDSLPLIVKYAETDAQKAARRARKLAAQNAATTRPTPTTAYFPFSPQVGVNQFPVVPQQMGLPGAIYPPAMAMTPYFPPTGVGMSLGAMTGMPMGYSPAITPYPTPIYGAAQPGLHPQTHPGVHHALPSTPYYTQHQHQHQHQQTHSYSNGGNLFVFHLPSDIDDTRLAQLFSPFGEVESVKVISDKTTGESKGYGFVKFYRMADAVNAISYMNGYAIGSKHLKVTFKTPSMRM